MGGGKGETTHCSAPSRNPRAKGGDRRRCKDKEKRVAGEGAREIESEGEREAFQDAITTFLGRASNQQLFL